MKCESCFNWDALKQVRVRDAITGRVEWFWVCSSCFFEAEDEGRLISYSQSQERLVQGNEDENKEEVKTMAGKMPTYRLVIGKRTVGTLWDSVSKAKGTKYFSGNIDVTQIRDAIKDAIAEGRIKKQNVRINKAGDTAEHEVTRIAMFEVVPFVKGSASSGSAGF